jgi:hypothetical protein
MDTEKQTPASTSFLHKVKRYFAYSVPKYAEFSRNEAVSVSGSVFTLACVNG